MAFLLQRLGNHLFERCYPLYRPIYSWFKAISDQSERKLLRAHLRPGMTVIDAGANIGVYSTFIAGLVGNSGKVHAFEPSPDNFAKLCDAARCYPQIICHPMALGSESREVSLYLSDALNVDHRMYAPPAQNRTAVPVRCLALDDFIPSGTVVHFIKADVQGWELEAMRGAERTIRESPDVKLLCEFWPFGLKSAGSDPKAFLEYLRDAGFQIRKVGKNGGLAELLEADCRVDETVTCNVFAARAKLGVEGESGFS